MPLSRAPLCLLVGPARYSPRRRKDQLLLIVIITHTSLVGKHYVQAGPYALAVGLLFLVELAFVKHVQRRVGSDPASANQVALTSHTVSMWYSGVSVILLAASTLAMILAT